MPTPDMLTPAKLMREIAGKRPAYGTGEPGKQRDASDGTPSVLTIQPNDRGKGGFIQAAAHGYTHDGPSQEHMAGLRGQTEDHQSSSEHQVAGDQYRTATEAVNEPSCNGAYGSETKSATEKAANTVGKPCRPHC
jgi:hypothetical protein